jgi:hypothetical protein
MTKELEPSQAVRHAKQWLKSIYADEKIENVGLEEVRWRNENWEITLGFDRFQDIAVLPAVVIPALSRPRRDYKVIVISGENNAVIEMRNREAVVE